MKNSIEFKRDEAGMKDLAIFLAQLTREGIVFTTRMDDVGIRVTLTGF